MKMRQVALAGLLIFVAIFAACAKAIPPWHPSSAPGPQATYGSQTPLAESPLPSQVNTEIRSFLSDSFRLSLAGVSLGQPPENAPGLGQDIFFRFPTLLQEGTSLTGLKSLCTIENGTDVGNRATTDLSGESCPIQYHDEFTLDPKGRYAYGKLDVVVKGSAAYGDIYELHAESSSSVLGSTDPTASLEIHETLESRLYGKIDLEFQIRGNGTTNQANMFWTSGSTSVQLTEWSSQESPSDPCGYAISYTPVTRGAFLSLAPVDFLNSTDCTSGGQ